MNNAEHDYCDGASFDWKRFPNMNEDLQSMCLSESYQKRASMKTTPKFSGCACDNVEDTAIESFRYKTEKTLKKLQDV